MQHNYIDSTEEVDGLIVQVVDDPFGEQSNPRDNDNVTEIFGSHRHYTIGDGEPPSEHMRILERGGIRLLNRFMRRFGDPRDGSKVFALVKLGMIDHSGISYYTVPLGANADHPMDPGGWDSGAVGYVLVTEKKWREMMGDMDPTAAVDGEVQFPLGSVPVKQQHAYRVIDQDVEEYDQWARGNVYGYVITKPCSDRDEHATLEAIAACPHAEVVDSCWGFIGDTKYAHEEAMAAAKAEKEGANA